MFGVDLDGVVFDFVTPFSLWLKQNLNIDYDDSQITDYHWYNCIPGLDKKKFYKEFDRFCSSGDFQYLKPFPGAKVAIDTLMQDNLVYFITSRPEKTREDTLVSLNKLFKVPEDRLIIAEHSKVDDIVRLDVSHFIDDAPKNVEEVSSHTCASVYLMDRLYNRDVKNQRVARVDGWLNFLEMINDGPK